MRIFLFTAIIMMVLCGCSGNVNEMIVQNETSGWDSPDSVSFEFPSLSLSNENLSRDACDSAPILSNGIQIPIRPIPADPINRLVTEPYAFTKATAPTSSMGGIYYSDGKHLPYLIWNYGHSPTPCGEWVYFVQPPGVTPPGPVRKNVNTGEVEYLDTSMIDPPCNYLVPADDGNAYIYGAMSPLDRMGWIHIVKNGEKIFSAYGSYLFPTLSADASTAAWCYDPSPMLFGTRHPYIMNIETQQVTRLHTCTSDQEAQWTCLTQDGEIAGFTVVIYGSDGLHDQEAWRYENNSSQKLDTLNYRWCDLMVMSPDGKYQVWAANQDPYVHRGYAVQSYLMDSDESVIVTPWNSGIQDIWPDVDVKGRIIFGHGVGYWSHYIPSLTYVHSGVIRTLFDPGGISRDFKFKR